MNFILEALILSSALVAGVAANDPATPPAADLKVGDPAPKFAALDDAGKEWKSEDHVGKNIVVVYFYPADMTGGCTKQACGFRDDLSKLKEEGVEVVGVSGNTVEQHQTFKKVYELNFVLLADTEGKVATAFGVPTSKGTTYNATVDGKEVPFTIGVVAKRWTFVIGKDGKIASKDTEVNAVEDSKTTLDTVAKLQKK
jgi:thioredoxin-dependent peroxiredoxin